MGAPWIIKKVPVPPPPVPAGLGSVAGGTPARGGQDRQTLRHAGTDGNARAVGVTGVKNNPSPPSEQSWG